MKKDARYMAKERGANLQSAICNLQIISIEIRKFQIHK